MTKTLRALERWLLPTAGRDGHVELVGGPDASAGFSSDTVLFDLVTSDSRSGYVLRLPPPPDAFPLFPWYDLPRQVAAMRLVRERTDVPVPQVPWLQPDGAVLGTPFYVMERVDGSVAPDMPPYVLEGWVLDASPGERAAMEAGVVRALAGIHSAVLGAADLAALEFDEPGDTPLRRHVAHQRRYYDWIRGTDRFAVIDALFSWLDARWPADDAQPVLSWGDSRVANVLFLGSDVVSVLDWEAVAVGPRELDLGWLLYFHDYYQRIAGQLGQPGLPDFLDRDRVVAAYRAETSHDVADLDWYLAYAALRQGLTSIRVSERAIRFGERLPPDDREDLVMDRAHIERIIRG
jgi:aminoglycoside phosphotransferase (APT) family kinase protein